jgi:hypothetical protein
MLKRALPTIKKGQLRIGPSGIEGAGNGVFVMETFKKGQIVTYYQGPIYSIEEFDKLKVGELRYITHSKQFVPSKFVQVGNQNMEGEWITNPAEELAESGICSYINDARQDDKQNVVFKFIDTKSNQDKVIRLLTDGGIPPTKKLIDYAKVLPVGIDNSQRLIVAVASRNIEVGEELFVNYGELHFELVKTGLQCSWCGTEDARVEEVNDSDLKFCDTSCWENYHL